MNLQALSREIHEEQGQEKKFQSTPLPTDMPIRIDMTIGDSAARIVKVKHQGVEETVRIMNKVLRKMNSDMKVELTKHGQPVVIPEIEESDEPNGKYKLSDLVSDEPVAVERS
jgi:hypothetical protein